MMTFDMIVSSAMAAPHQKLADSLAILRDLQKHTVTSFGGTNFRVCIGCGWFGTDFCVKSAKGWLDLVGSGGTGWR